MKRLVVIRDDDINFFTRPALLKELYGPLFERDLPVSFSVIPEVSADTPLALGEESAFFRKFGLRHEPFIPPADRGRKARYLFPENPKLVAFIREQPVEVVQHGFNHQWNGGAEFEARDEIALAKRIEHGRRILRDTFGWQPEFFCPPWDRISREGLRALKRVGFLGISAARFGRNLPCSAWPAWMWSRRNAGRRAFWWNRFLFVGHPGYVTSLFRDSRETMKLFRAAYESSRILVLVNHHWEFNFDDQARMDPKRAGLWHEILDFVLRDRDTEIVSFRTLYDRLRAN